MTDDIQMRPSDTCIYSFRLSKSEMDGMEDAASREGIKLAEYVRRAIRLCIGGGMPYAPAVNWCVSTPYADMGHTTTWNEARCRANVDLTVRYL